MYIIQFAEHFYSVNAYVVKQTLGSTEPCRFDHTNVI